jgi:transcription initiation factor TFIIIB Brf1 subunit/transcription initiation factor TFIIB
MNYEFDDRWYKKTIDYIGLIEELGKELSLDVGIVEEAKGVFSTFRGSSYPLKNSALAALYKAARTSPLCVTPSLKRWEYVLKEKHLFNMTQVFKIYREMLLIFEEKPVACANDPKIYVENYLSLFAQKTVLQDRVKIKNDALDVLSLIARERGTPIAKTAVALYVSLNQNNCAVSQKEIGKLFSLTETTMQNNFKIYREKRSRLTP